MRREAKMRPWSRMVWRGLMGFGLLLAAGCFEPLLAGAAGHTSPHRTYRASHHSSRTLHRRSHGEAVARRHSPGRLAGSRRAYRRVRYRRVRYRRWRRHRVTLPRAPSAGRTEQIQSALARGGYYQGDPNGRWDSGTQDALRRFQMANGLPPTGKLDALSLQKLGLGSSVAGVSAPRPVTPGGQPAASTKPPGD